MRLDIRRKKLPDMFVFRDGTRVHTKEDWFRRREEILEEVINLEFDGMPPKPEVFEVSPASRPLGKMGVSYRVQCGTKEKTFSFSFVAHLPQKGEGKKYPVVVTGEYLPFLCCRPFKYNTS